MTTPTPYRDATPVDATAVECARVHEIGETDMAAFKQREETKRAALAARDTSGYLVSRVSMAVVALAAIAAGGELLSAHIKARNPTPPDPPAACVESAELVSINSAARTCSGGGLITTEKVNENHVLVKCRCGAAPAGTVTP